MNESQGEAPLTKSINESLQESSQESSQDNYTGFISGSLSPNICFFLTIENNSKEEQLVKIRDFINDFKKVAPMFDNGEGDDIFRLSVETIIRTNFEESNELIKKVFGGQTGECYIFHNINTSEHSRAVYQIKCYVHDELELKVSPEFISRSILNLSDDNYENYVYPFTITVNPSIIKKIKEKQTLINNITKKSE